MVVGDSEHPKQRRAGPIRRARRWYRRFNYESASRPRTAWSIRIDIALILTVFLAIVINFVLQSAVQRQVDSKTIDFQVFVQNDTVMLDRISEKNKSTTQDLVHVTLTTTQAGWPLSTAIISQNPRVSWSLPGLKDDIERTIQPLAPLSQHLELEPEIRSALLSSSDADIRRFGEGREVHMDYILFFIMTGVTWFLLWVLSLPILGLVGIGEGAAGRVGAHVRRSRRKQNRCERCGYDLKGLDFVAACPECGELLT